MTSDTDVSVIVMPSPISSDSDDVAKGFDTGILQWTWINFSWWIPLVNSRIKGGIAGYDNQSIELIVYEDLLKVKVFSTSIIAIIAPLVEDQYDNGFAEWYGWRN